MKVQISSELNIFLEELPRIIVLTEIVFCGIRPLEFALGFYFIGAIFL